ncbi:hypothetical protein PUN28_007899 [Cardiocondyla obscurior]|uniref:Uncharacterized protein n=1 Tax=Cardiocondyla obscurior TaxID=286306 RepID=A0AAW2G0A2_9HYME
MRVSIIGYLSKQYKSQESNNFISINSNDYRTLIKQFVHVKLSTHEVGGTHADGGAATTATGQWVLMLLLLVIAHDGGLPFTPLRSKQMEESAAPFSTHSVSGLSCAGRSLVADRLGNWKEPGSLDVDERVVRSATFEFSGETLVEVEEAGDTLREAPTSNCFCLSDSKSPLKIDTAYVTFAVCTIHFYLHKRRYNSVYRELTCRIIMAL